MDAIKKRFLKRVDVLSSDECWIWRGPVGAGGYGKFSIHGRLDYAHRASFEIFNGIRPLFLFVLHSCDNPSCVNPAHLFVGTPADNSADMVRKGRSCRGEAHWRARLTDQQVAEIVSRVAGGETQRAIAAEFGVSYQHVSDLCSGRRRRFVETERAA